MSDAAKVVEALQASVGIEWCRTIIPVHAYRVDGCAPWAVVLPGTVHEVSAVLSVAYREALALIPWGGGTTMSLGHPPERLDLILSLARLNGLLAHEPAD